MGETMRSFTLLLTMLVACGGSQTNNNTNGNGTGGGGGDDGNNGSGTSDGNGGGVDDGIGVVVTGDPPKLCVDVPTLNAEDNLFPEGDLLQEAIGIEAKPDPTTWIIEALGSEDEYTIVQTLHIHDGTWIVVYSRCTGKRTCSVHLARAAQISADDRYEIKQTIDFTFDEEPFGEQAEGLDVPIIGFGDLNDDKAPELWVYFDISGEPRPAVGETVHHYMAAYTLPDLKELIWTKVGMTPGGTYEQTCAFEVSLYDLDCDDHHDVLVSTECGTNMCVADPEDPECAGSPNAFARESYVWMPKVGRFFATNHDYDIAAIREAQEED